MKMSKNDNQLNEDNRLVEDHVLVEDNRSVGDHVLVEDNRPVGDHMSTGDNMSSRNNMDAPDSHGERRRPGYLRCFSAFIIGVFIAYGLQLRLGIPKDFSAAKTASFKGHPFQLLIYFLRRSAARPVNYSLQCELTAIVLIIIILYVFSQRYRIREIIWCILFACLFALCTFFGQIFMVNPFWNVYLTGTHQLIKDICFLGSYGAACFFAMLALWAALKQLVIPVSGLQRFSGRKRALLYFLIIMICWIPVYYIFWPGNLKGDMVVQILQYFHFPTHFQAHWISDGKKVIFTNDHPFLQTIIFGAFMDLGHMLGRNELGVGLYVLLQLVGFAAAVSAFLVSLDYFDTPAKLTRTALILYALAPPYVIHAVLISGDSALTLFFLLFMLSCFWIYKTKGEILSNKAFTAFTFIIILLFCGSKNQCIYIVVLAGLLMLIVFRKHWKKVLITVFIPLLVFEVLYMGVLFKVMHVERVGSQEALSLFFQQTARTVKYHENELTDEQKEAIDAVLDLDSMAESYNPDLADPVKKKFNQKASRADLIRYFKVWFEMGLRYPGEYIQSFLDSVWEYYYPIKPPEASKFYWDNYSLDQIWGSGWIHRTVPYKFFEERWFSQPSATEDFRDGYRQIAKTFNELPLLSWLSYPGTVMWIALMLLLLLLLFKDYHSLGAFFPVLLVFAICLLSPKNGNYRYMLPNGFILPVMAAYVIGLIPFKKVVKKPGQAERKAVFPKPEKINRGNLPDYLL